MKTIMIIWGVLGAITLVVILLLWSVMSPSSFLHSGARQSDALQTTISADGQMVAVRPDKPNQSVLQVRHLVNDNAWRKIPLPPNTRTIRFGLKGYELLFVFRKDGSDVDVLAKLDVAQADKPFEVIHEHHTLNFPIEVRPGQIMVRTQSLDPATGKVDQFTSSGMLLERNKAPVLLGPIDAFAAGTPSVVDTGFFYFLDGAVTRTDSHIRSYALPGGKAPIIVESFVDKTGRSQPFQTSTSNYFCDYKAIRCLRGYVTQPYTSPFVYAFDIYLGEQRCALTNVLGYFESESITPDGKTAVFALAGEPGTRVRSPQIIVASFAPQQCAPVSVQRFNFEEK